MDTLDTYEGVNRVEVIGLSGRLLTEYGSTSITLSFQDDMKTLKVFLNYGEATKNLVTDSSGCVMCDLEVCEDHKGEA